LSGSDVKIETPLVAESVVKPSVEVEVEVEEAGAVKEGQGEKSTSPVGKKREREEETEDKISSDREAAEKIGGEQSEENDDGADKEGKEDTDGQDPPQKEESKEMEEGDVKDVTNPVGKDEGTEDKGADDDDEKTEPAAKKVKVESDDDAIEFLSETAAADAPPKNVVSSSSALIGAKPGSRFAWSVPKKKSIKSEEPAPIAPANQQQEVGTSTMPQQLGMTSGAVVPVSVSAVSPQASQAPLIPLIEIDPSYTQDLGLIRRLHEHAQRVLGKRCVIEWFEKYCRDVYYGCFLICMFGNQVKAGTDGDALIKNKKVNSKAVEQLVSLFNFPR